METRVVDSVVQKKFPISVVCVYVNKCRFGAVTFCLTFDQMDVSEKTDGKQREWYRTPKANTVQTVKLFGQTNNDLKPYAYNVV